MKGLEGSQVKRDTEGCFDSFMSCGSVSIKEKGGKKPIVILRDTGQARHCYQLMYCLWGKKAQRKHMCWCEV